MPDPQIDDQAQGPRALREAYERAQAEAQEGLGARRELAFLKAGLDVDNPTVKFAMTHYDGELSKDAVLEFAAGVGLSQPTAPPEPEPPAPEITDLRRELAGAAAAPPPDPTLGGDPMEEAWGEYHRLVREGETGERAARAVFGTIMAGAAAGDPRFAFDAEAHKALAREQK